LYVRESLPTVMCESLMNCLIDDSLWCVTTLPNYSKLLISVVYRSPSFNEVNDSNLVNIFSNLWNFQNSSNLLIKGDFNVQNIDWQECMYLHNNSSFESKFLNATLDSILSQHVISFTRHIPEQRFSILDL